MQRTYTCKNKTSKNVQMRNEFAEKVQTEDYSYHPETETMVLTDERKLCQTMKNFYKWIISDILKNVL